MESFYSELKKILENTLVWSENFKKGERDYNFDIDNELYFLSKEHQIDSRKDDTLVLIYNLLDFYSDAVKHEFKQIDKNYSISDAYADIESIIAKMEDSEDLSSFQLSNEMTKRLRQI